MCVNDLLSTVVYAQKACGQLCHNDVCASLLFHVLTHSSCTPTTYDMLSVLPAYICLKQLFIGLVGYCCTGMSTLPWLLPSSLLKQAFFTRIRITISFTSQVCKHIQGICFQSSTKTEYGNKMCIDSESLCEGAKFNISRPTCTAQKQRCSDQLLMIAVTYEKKLCLDVWANRDL